MADEIRDNEGTIVVPMIPRPSRTNDRMTVKMELYHERIGNQPDHLPMSFSKLLSTTEQSYKRHQIATQEWLPLDMGYLADKDKAGYIQIVNNAGKFLQVNPTEEEKATIAASLIQLRLGKSGGTWDIPPGEGIFGKPSDITKVQVRVAPDGPDEVEFVVNILPR